MVFVVLLFLYLSYCFTYYFVLVLFSKKNCMFSGRFKKRIIVFFFKDPRKQ